MPQNNDKQEKCPEKGCLRTTERQKHSYSHTTMLSSINVRFVLMDRESIEM